jgi:hypothetical protein
VRLSQTEIAPSEGAAMQETEPPSRVNEQVLPPERRSLSGFAPTVKDAPVHPPHPLAPPLVVPASPLRRR